jgi:hypothetical protein
MSPLVRHADPHLGKREGKENQKRFPRRWRWARLRRGGSHTRAPSLSIHISSPCEHDRDVLAQVHGLKSNRFSGLQRHLVDAHPLANLARERVKERSRAGERDVVQLAPASPSPCCLNRLRHDLTRSSRWEDRLGVDLALKCDQGEDQDTKRPGRHEPRVDAQGEQVECDLPGPCSRSRRQPPERRSPRRRARDKLALCSGAPLRRRSGRMTSETVLQVLLRTSEDTGCESRG